MRMDEQSKEMTVISGKVQGLPALVDAQTGEYNLKGYDKVVGMTYAERMAGIYKTVDEIWGDKVAEDISEGLRHASLGGEIKRTLGDKTMSADLYVALELAQLTSHKDEWDVGANNTAKQLLYRDVALMAWMSPEQKGDKHMHWQTALGDIAPLLRETELGIDSASYERSLTIRTDSYGDPEGLQLSFKKKESVAPGDENGGAMLDTFFQVDRTFAGCGNFRANEPEAFNAHEAYGEVRYYKGSDKMVVGVRYSDRGVGSDRKLELESLIIDLFDDKRVDLAVTWDHGRLSKIHLPVEYSAALDAGGKENADKGGYDYEINEANRNDVVNEVNRMFREMYGVDDAMTKIEALKGAENIPVVAGKLFTIDDGIRAGGVKNSADVWNAII